MTKPFVDIDAALDAGLKREAAQAEGDAVLSEIDSRQLAILDELTDGRPDVKEQRTRVEQVAASRRHRADGIAKRAGVKDIAELVDMRLDVAQRLRSAREAQVMLDEKFANVDLYAVSGDETWLSRHPNSPPPQTASQIELNCLQGRAAVQALEEWLEAHPGPDPDDGTDPMRQQAVEALKLWNAEHKANKKTRAGKDDQPPATKAATT